MPHWNPLPQSRQEIRWEYMDAVPLGDGADAVDFGASVQAVTTIAAAASTETVRNLFTPLPFSSPLGSLAAYAGVAPFSLLSVPASHPRVSP
ncbi:hypothetical protein GCM10023196_004350 [Actinoallomurus vinaceus]|uniref:Uncharacterized protein n=1 Tax=Actinoallomurus vinaceus TaxID=1080074 RepID=A0ABP8U204_9ACTN